MKKVKLNKLLAFSLSTFMLFQSFSFKVLADEPSGWAKNEVKVAIEKGLVPSELQNSYSKSITRQEFCKLSTAVMKAWSSEFTYDTEGVAPFEDCSDKDVLNCAKLTIVSGVGNNKFAPNNPIKRQEAARMLYKTLDVATPVISEAHGKAPIGFYSSDVPHSFNDGGEIKSWARSEINNMYRFGVMLGVSNNNYDPNGYYTREQAICTFLRLYYCFGNMEKNSLQKDYFPNKQTAEDYLSDGLLRTEGYDLYDKDSYELSFIDNEGNLYSQKDKGYVYPFDRKYGVIENVAPSQNLSFLVDKNGNKVFDEGWSDIDINDNSILLSSPKDGIYRLYKNNDNVANSLVAESNLFITGIGDELYAVAEENNKMKVINANGEVLAKDIDTNGYGYIINITSYNNIFVVRYSNEKYAVLKNDGSKAQLLKEFTVPKNWEFEKAVGSNICFNDTSDNKKILYRGVSGKYYKYDGVELTENNEAIAAGPNYHDYILNSDGSVKFDAGTLGYKNISKINDFDFYKALKDNGESGKFDIVDKNGKIIRQNVNNSLVMDKSGLVAYYENNNIYFFDFFGEDIGNVGVSDIFYSEAENKEIKNIKFIKGLLWINAEDKVNSSENESFYVMPDGQRINLS